MSARGALRAVGAAALALFAALAFTPLAGVLYRVLVPPAPPPEAAPAIVVLGAGVDEGVLTDHSLRRALGGVALFRRGLAPLIVMLGPGRSGRSEAEVRVRLAEELGVPSSALLADPRGSTTRDEARVCWEDLAPRGVRKILLVTGGQHMPRAAALFRRVGFEVVPAPVHDMPSDVDRPEARLEVAHDLLGELLARALGRVAERR
jgi:uncharacterized SAM-binding protein YcdF (DUF218 family)